MSLADAKALLNGRVWRTEINAAVNEGVYGTDYAHVEKAVPRFPWCLMAYIVTEKTHMPVRVAWSRERYRARRCERRRGHCASGRGRPQEEGNRDARAGGGRGAKGTKDGRVSAASRFPCRDGKLRVKIFSRLAPYEKWFLINILHATLGPNRRRGRELAGKLENPRIADWH